MDIDVMTSPMSHQQHSFEHNTLSLAVTMPQECSNITSSDASVTSSGVGPLFQGTPNWDWRIQGYTTILPPLPPSNTQFSEMISELHNVASAGSDAVLQDVALSSLSPVLEERPHILRTIRAKPVTPPLDRFINVGSNEVATKSPRRPGRQNPLDAETKEDAAFMRIIHACAPCFVNNSKVSHDQPYQEYD